MKRLFALLALVLIPVSLSACGEEYGPPRPGANTPEPPTPDWIHQTPSMQPIDPAQVISDPDTGLQHVSGEAIVRLAPLRTRSDFETELAGVGFPAQVVGEVPDFRLLQVRYDTPDDTAARAALAGLPSGEAASANIMHVTTDEYDDPVLNDSDANNDWGLQKINAKRAWGTSTGDGVNVAVIDDGVRTDHPDLKGRVTKTYSYKTKGAEQKFETYRDPFGRMERVGEHGTHVAGTIAAIANNGEGTVGVAPDVEIFSYQVIYLHNSGDNAADPYVAGALSDIADAISRAVGAGANVINMSLGPDWSGAAERLAIEAERPRVEQQMQAFIDGALPVYQGVMSDVIARNVIVVVAAGNDNVPARFAPLARVTETITVGATDQSDRPAGFSNFDDGKLGRIVDVAAPGVQIYSGQYYGFGYKDGTSMACPHVAGIAALLKSVAPSAAHAEVREILTNTGIAIGGSKDLGQRVDAGAALAELARRRSILSKADAEVTPPADPALPVGATWAGNPGEDVDSILALPNNGGWLGTMTRVLIDKFLEAGHQFGGRYDEYGRLIMPPSIVAMGTPDDYDQGDRHAYVWEKKRDIVGVDGLTLEEYVTAELKKILGDAKPATPAVELTADLQKMVGIWDGRYWPDGDPNGQGIQFTAFLSDLKTGAVGGWTREFFPQLEREVRGEIYDMKVNGVELSFSKRYAEGSGLTQVVSYVGRYEADGPFIDGKWRIQEDGKVSSGAWQMTVSRGR